MALAAISVGWSAYVSGVLPLLGLSVPREFLAGPFSGGIVNLPAMLIIFIMALLQLKGTKESARLNNLLVAIKLAVVIAFLILAADHIQVSNYRPFSLMAGKEFPREPRLCFSPILDSTRWPIPRKR